MYVAFTFGIVALRLAMHAESPAFVTLLGFSPCEISPWVASDSVPPSSSNVSEAVLLGASGRTSLALTERLRSLPLGRTCLHQALLAESRQPWVEYEK